jgi:hypothetical protein
MNQRVMSFKRVWAGWWVAAIALALTGCASAPRQAEECGGGSDCPPAGAVEDPFIEEIYATRDWNFRDELAAEGADPVRIASEAELPIEAAEAMLFDTRPERARDSLAAKIWMIENARHTVDIAYYIFRNDLVGQALLAAACDAVIRGVDVRILYDSAGSMTLGTLDLGWLTLCEENAGWIRTADGQVSTRRARIQVAIFNALSNLSTSPNRRSHDKLLAVDARFGEAGYLMTGGRNISLDYYAVTAEGEADPKAYMDMELLLRPGERESEYSVGDISSGYFTLLFNFRGNRLLSNRIRNEQQLQLYYDRQARAYDALRTLRNLPIMAPHFAAAEALDEADGWENVRSLLAHNMSNLDNRGVVKNAVGNMASNPNSILSVLGQVADRVPPEVPTRLVSPYLFLARYEAKSGNVLVDEAQSILEHLGRNPESRFELITNSVLTSDNFSAQAIIDFDTAPRLLLTPELRERWLALSGEEEAQSELVNSPEWKAAIDNAQVVIYETGGVDAYAFGGETVYGKLHAKYWQASDIGFVGTDNFDYRSRLFNSEMGYFFQGQALADDLAADFERLKKRSVRWGSSEWLELRRQTMQLKGTKGMTTRTQRNIYKTLKTTGLHWLF